MNLLFVLKRLLTSHVLVEVVMRYRDSNNTDTCLHQGSVGYTFYLGNQTNYNLP